jgi:hypothetical protein
MPQVRPFVWKNFLYIESSDHELRKIFQVMHGCD